MIASSSWPCETGFGQSALANAVQRKGWSLARVKGGHDIFVMLGRRERRHSDPRQSPAQDKVASCFDEDLGIGRERSLKTPNKAGGGNCAVASSLHTGRRRRAVPDPTDRMPYEIKLTNAEAILTAVVRSRVPARELSKFVPAACGEVWSFIRSAGLPRPGRHVALYLNAGLVEVGAEVSETFTGNDRVHCSQLPGGRVVTTTHFGPYGRLGDVHSEIRQWCAAHGYRLSGICWEIYGHWEESWNADPSKIRTDVFHLLEDKKG